MTTVSLGTRAQATAVTILAPCLAIPRLVVAADHETGDVLQEQQWNQTLVAQLDEMRPLRADSPNSTPLLATIPTGWP